MSKYESNYIMIHVLLIIRSKCIKLIYYNPMIIIQKLKGWNIIIESLFYGLNAQKVNNPMSCQKWGI